MIAAGLILIGQSYHLTAFSIDNGRVRWKRTLDSQRFLLPSQKILARKSCHRGVTPTVVDDKIYLPTCGGELLQLRLADGTIQFRSVLGVPLRAAPVVTPSGVTALAISFGKVARASGLFALDPTLRRQRWLNRRVQVPIGAVTSPEIAAHDGRLFLSLRNKLIAVRQSDGQHLWSTSAWHGSVAANRQGVVLCSALGTTLRAPTDGRVRWRNRAPCSRLVVSERLVVGYQPRTAELVALDLRSGKERWRYKSARLALYSGMTAAGGVLYLGRGEGVVAVDLKNGVRLWRHIVGKGALYTTPVPAGDSLYFSTGIGWLVRLQRR